MHESLTLNCGHDGSGCMVSSHSSLRSEQKQAHYEVSIVIYCQPWTILKISRWLSDAVHINIIHEFIFSYLWCSKIFAHLQASIIHWWFIGHLLQWLSGKFDIVWQALYAISFIPLEFSCMQGRYWIWNECLVINYDGGFGTKYNDWP